MKKSVPAALLLLFAFAAQGALAQTYPSTCPAEAQAIVTSVGGCSSVDPALYKNVYDKCCSSTTLTTGSGGGTTTTPAPVVTISATPDTIDYNQRSTLSWAATNATSCTASGDWSGNKATSFQETAGPLTANKTYKITCTGAGGTGNTAQVTVNVRPQTTGGGSTSLTTSGSSCDATAQMIINSLGGCSKIDVSQYKNIKEKCCTGAGGTGGTGGPSTGSTGSPQAGSGQAGGGGGGTGGVRPVGGASGRGADGGRSGPSTGSGQGGGGGRAGTLSPTMVFVVDNSQIQKGQSVKFSWSSTNAESCHASGDWSGSKGTSGSETVGPLQSGKDFSLTCKSGSAPSASSGQAEARRNISITVLGPAGEKPPAATPLPQTTRRTPPAAIQPRVAEEPIRKAAQERPAQAGKQVKESAVPAVSPPIISFSADATLAEGDSTTLVWAVSNADSCIALGSWSGDKPLYGSESTGVIKDDSMFVLICKGEGGEASKAMKISVSGKGKGLIATLFDGIVGLFTGGSAEQAQPAPSVEETQPDELAEAQGVSGKKFTGPPQVTLLVTPIVRAGRTATIEWEAQNVSECRAGGAWSGGKQASGREISATLSADTTYTLICAGRNGATASASATTVVYAENVLGNTVDAVKNIFDNIFR